MNRELLFAEERQNQILQLLRREQKLLVPDLCKRFSVSPATIRNDLNDLESRGLLKRTHGGAILNSKTGFEANSSEKEVKESHEKQVIGRLAASLVEDGDTLVVDTGTTTLAFVRCLTEKKRLTVVTNDIQIAAFLEDQTDAAVILTGGTLRRGFHCTVGPVAEQALAGLRVDKCFLGTNGLTLDSGLTTPDVGHAAVKRQMIKIGSQLIVLCDSGKIGANGFACVAPLNQVDILVTDSGLDEEQKARLEEAGIDVRVAEK